MKKIIFVVVAFLGLGMASCGNSSKKQETAVTPQTEVKTVDVEKALYLEDLLTKAETEVGKEVVLRGKITHTCKHSGRRCFVVGKNDSTLSIRVEAKGNIGGFNRELIGSEVAIKGILRENRMSEEDIKSMEEELKKQQANAKNGAESCDSEMKNIKGMRDWMKANNKEFYSIYFMEGLEFEVVE